MKFAEYFEIASNIDSWTIEEISSDARRITPADYLKIKRARGRTAFYMMVGSGDARYFFTVPGDKRGEYTFVEFFKDAHTVTVQFYKATMISDRNTRLSMKMRREINLATSSAIFSGVSACVKHYSEKNGNPIFSFTGVKEDSEGDDHFSTSKRTSIYTRMLKRFGVTRAWRETRDNNAIYFTVSPKGMPKAPTEIERIL